MTCHSDEKSESPTSPCHPNGAARRRCRPGKRRNHRPAAKTGIVFRAKFLDFLGAAYAANILVFPATAAALASAERFDALLAVVRKKKWVVYAKRPFASPECVLAYLGRYTHRVVIDWDEP